ncbi:MAG: hypothetical protein IJ680_08275 [Paludibacteraceae bacterium]|nr:hypothetical protein [Paludibacteraceae bacterium]
MKRTLFTVLAGVAIMASFTACGEEELLSKDLLANGYWIRQDQGDEYEVNAMQFSKDVAYDYVYDLHEFGYETHGRGYGFDGKQIVIEEYGMMEVISLTADMLVVERHWGGQSASVTETYVHADRLPYADQFADGLAAIMVGYGVYYGDMDSSGDYLKLEIRQDGYSLYIGENINAKISESTWTVSSFNTVTLKSNDGVETLNITVSNKGKTLSLANSKEGYEITLTPKSDK